MAVNRLALRLSGGGGPHATEHAARILHEFGHDLLLKHLNRRCLPDAGNLLKRDVRILQRVRLAHELPILDSTAQRWHLPGDTIIVIQRVKVLTPKPVAALRRADGPQPAVGVDQHRPQHFIPGRAFHVRHLIDHHAVSRVATCVVRVVERAIDDGPTCRELGSHALYGEFRRITHAVLRLLPADAHLVKRRRPPQNALAPCGLFHGNAHAHRCLAPAPTR